ncbi:MAG: SulP family sulfate transporter [Alphaproteobacteria bacterium RIFCSPHIGHO2_12_FULL_63_12]|nr:MAG: SulP family sulfate transporter [Alphaproteobacteria bacterium RIFCSPHIGHO2_12_FULL_63_12]
MSDNYSAARRAAAPTFAELFTPKLITVLREGYGAKEFRADGFAGLTVAIVALPLSMAIAIASGLAPERGLYAAIVGGFFVSMLGGSRFQVGGPAGAFIVLVAASAARHGLDGVLLATFLAGLMLTAAGYLRLGSYVQLIPFPVTVGFTAGIAVIIFTSQIKDLLGLTIAEGGHGPIFESLKADFEAIGTFNPFALAVAAATVAMIVGLRKWRPSFPGILVAVAATSAAVALFDLPVVTIAGRFGAIPSGLPAPSFPHLSFASVSAVMPDAFAFFLLGAIESLLSATVADSMTGRRHRANCELTGQGAANIASAIFGGMVVTGTIARTATNIRAGAHGPVAGMLHSAFLLAFMIVAAPLAGYAPLASLAGVLAIVAWNMVEKESFAALIRASRGDAAALLATFFLTIFRSLTEAIAAGVAIGAIAFIHRMASAAQVTTAAPLIRHDRADGEPADREAYDPASSAGSGSSVAIYRISGAVFFGSAASLGLALDRILAGEKTFILDFAAAAFIDSSGAQAIRGFVEKARRQNVDVIITAASELIRGELTRAGLDERRVRYAASIDAASVENSTS